MTTAEEEVLWVRPGESAFVLMVDPIIGIEGDMVIIRNVPVTELGRYVSVGDRFTDINGQDYVVRAKMF